MQIEKINELPNGIEIIYADGADYYIPKMRYDEVIDGNISSWINQIMWKKWSDIDSLYRTAAIISRHIKPGLIDWEETFLKAERLFAVRHIQQKEDEDKPKKVIWSGKDIAEREKRFMETARSLNTDEINELTMDVVLQKLKEHKIPGNSQRRA